MPVTVSSAKKCCLGSRRSGEERSDELGGTEWNLDIPVAFRYNEILWSPFRVLTSTNQVTGKSGEERSDEVGEDGSAGSVPIG